MSESQGRIRPAVLLVEDQDALREGLAQALASRYLVTTAASGPEAVRAAEREAFDLVLLDVNLPGMDGMEVMHAARPLQPDAEFLLMTGFGSVGGAVDAMRMGAFDYLSKPVSIPELLLRMERALAERELRRELAGLRLRTPAVGVQRMLGRSPALRRVLDLVERVAPTRATVLVTGETGTGKELVARAIHDLSDRARRPFVAVNCAALPESLLESELFGHVKGAFTGAVASRRGLVEEAAGGTLFLDEVAAIPASLQVKLLRVLQERTIQRVGDSRPVPVDFRLVAAGNQDLAAEVAAGRFREDLFYRLNVFPITVPPLRERREDVPLLAGAFRQRAAEETGVAPPEIPAETMERLTRYDWPGNVRELENFIQRAVIMHAGARILPVHVPRARGTQALVDGAVDEEWTLERLDREYTFALLRRLDGRMGRTAQALGVDARTLTRKMQRWRDEGFSPPESDDE